MPLSPSTVHRAVIVGRIAPGAEEEVARIFAEFDASELPSLVGVRHRSLFVLGDLYIHLLETEDDPSKSVARVREHPLFVEISRRLQPYVTPYDPRTWRSPADAMAQPFYHWSAPND